MNIIDSVVGFLNPKAGYNRALNRARMLSMQDQVRRYEGAAAGRRHSGWLMQTNPSVNDLIKKDHKNLVARSREISINNSYARKAAITIANNTVGTGILPEPYVVDSIKAGKVVANAKGDAEIIGAIRQAWKQWAESISADYDGDNTFYGLQHLAIRTIVVSGEILAIRKRVKTDVNRFGLQIKLLEADYIDITKDTKEDLGGGYTRQGIVYDSLNKRKGYWIYDRHPSEGEAKSQIVNISDIIHVYDVERVGQARGVPASASTLLKQRDTDDYSDAELLGKKAQACMPIFVQKNTIEESNPDDDERIESIEPGAINYLNNGETVTLASVPSSVGFSDFIKEQHRAIAAGYLMTYELFTGDLSNVNFSSGRMGALEFQKVVEFWQHLMFIPKFCDTIFSWFIEAAKLADGHNSQTTILARWTAPRREMIDPAKEVAANRSAVRAGFTTWQNIVRESGYNPDEILKDMIAANKAFKAAGLMPDSDASFELSAKAAAGAPDNNTAKEDE